MIIFSMHANEEYVGEALDAGVTGYLLKGAEPAELELARKAIMRGETYLITLATDGSPASAKALTRPI